jgi:hypothetical protein
MQDLPTIDLDGYRRLVPQERELALTRPPTPDSLQNGRLRHRSLHRLGASVTVPYSKSFGIYPSMISSLSRVASCFQLAPRTCNFRSSIRSLPR